MQLDIAGSQSAQHSVAFNNTNWMFCLKEKNLTNKNGKYLSVFLLIRLHFVFPS